MQYAGLLKAGVKAGVIIAGAVWAVSYSLPSNASTPYIVRASGQEAASHCVYGALAPLQATAFEGFKLVPVPKGEFIEGVIVMRQGEKIPDPRDVKQKDNLRLERILNACTPQDA